MNSSLIMTLYYIVLTVRKFYLLMQYIGGINNEVEGIHFLHFHYKPQQ